MSDLIDRQVVLKKLGEMTRPYGDGTSVYDSGNFIHDETLADVSQMISELPTIEIVKVHSKDEFISKSVINDIKAEIQALPKTYPFVNHIDTYVKDADVIKIIERHCGGDTE